MIRVYTIILLCFFLAGNARADWVFGRGERFFSPQTAEVDACLEAEGIARENALKAHLGERLFAEDLMTCSERGGEPECSFSRSMHALVDGDIRGVRNLVSSVSASPPSDIRKCVVTLEADVDTAKGLADPGFDLDVRLNRRVLREGDVLFLELSPTVPMHVAVFQWQPQEHLAGKVTRLFPNAFDQDNLVNSKTTVPTTVGAKRYVLKAVFPTKGDTSKRLADEYLLVVGTVAPVEFLDSYDMDMLRARILEIPRSQVRVVKRAYAIVREP